MILLGSKVPYCYAKVESDYFHKPLYQRMMNVVTTILHTLRFFLALAPDFIRYQFYRHPNYCDPSANQCWKEGNQGLYVLITGLKSHPIWAEGHRVRIEVGQPEMEVRIPFVPENGDCSLEEAAAPIIEMVRDYIRKNPQKPICLIGTSNGGRVAAKVELALRGEGAAIRVSTLAGVFFGSRRIDQFAHWNIAQYLYNPAVIDELQIGSETAKALIKEMRASLPEKDTRAYEFFTSTNDEFVPNFSSCLPILGKGETFHVMEGENHFSITHAAREKQLQNAFAWMKKIIA